MSRTVSTQSQGKNVVIFQFSNCYRSQTVTPTVVTYGRYISIHVPNCNMVLYDGCIVPYCADTVREPHPPDVQITVSPIVLLTPQIQLAESSLTRNSSLELIFGVQYMSGARWRTKTGCFKIHYRAEVEIKVETLIFYDKVRQSVLRYISNKKNT